MNSLEKSAPLPLDLPRTIVPTFKGFNDLLAEIQVRTLSQHTWAEASHIIHYKDLKSTPPELIRTISRASALLEIVDLEFERVLTEKETYRESIDEIIVEADSNTSLNVDILEKILDKMLPKKNKSGGEDYGEILDVLFKSEIKTIGQLTKMINAKKDAVIKEDQRITKYIIEHFNPKVDINLIEIDKGKLYEVEDFIDITKRGAFYSQTGLINGMLK